MISEFYNRNDSFSRPVSFEKIKRLVDRGKKLKILDLACGDGRVTEELVKAGYEVWGVDVSKKAVGLARKRGIRAEIGEIEKYNPNQRFDLIIMVDILEHLFEPLEMLKKANNWLIESGQMIVSMPNHFDLRNRLRMLRGKSIVHWDHAKLSRSWNYHHIRFLTLNEFRAMISKAGFYIVKEQYNFMGSGIVPTCCTPGFLRYFLVKTWPGLFSGKFIFLLQSGPMQKVKKIYLTKTVKGL